MIWAIKVALLEIPMDKITWYKEVFDFEWQALTINDKVVGSPGLLCSDFLEYRTNDGL
jgi:hypothetical protein